MNLPEINGAAEAISAADALLFAAGAGMGVDSGLPDFRGDAGFWKAYPPFEKLGYSFIEMANPEWFDRDPELAWGFYGHRQNLYRRTEPHVGFEILRNFAAKKPGGAFVFTSNVDGHFQRAGFSEDAVIECHGSIHFLQRADGSGSVWPSDGTEIAVNEETMRATGELPRCPESGKLARPNILMFGDWLWRSERTDAQEERYRRWLEDVENLAIIEMGAGTAVPSVRREMERIAAKPNSTLIRINPRESKGRPGTISLPLGALDALHAIADHIA